MKPHRLYAAGPLAMAATSGLFLMMNALVSGGDEVVIDNAPQRPWVDFVQVPDSPPPVREIERIDKPEEVADPPEQLPLPPLVSGEPTKVGPHIPGPVITDKDPGFPDFASLSDGEYLPLVRIQPSYPRRAQERGIEGYAVVELTVEADGSVPAESVVIIDAEPKGYFEREAIKAARKFKYKPKVVNGRGQTVTGVQYRFSFNISD